MTATASVARCKRKSYDSNPVAYYITWFLIGVIMRLVFRYRIHGRENVPAQGAAIVAVNHLHYIDPGAVAPAVRRRLITMAADKWQEDGFSGLFLRIAGVIFVRRGEVDRQALRDCLDVLSQGRLLAIAPEGTRSKTGGLQRGRAGIAYLANKANVPIIPVGFWGTEQIRNWRPFRRPRCEITLGEPFYLPSYEGRPPTELLDQWADLVMIKIGLLLPPQYRGVYAERIAAVERGESHELDVLRPVSKADDA
jgi:1-acyl-sn-glycerol-3-phosphate acyltransferase